MTSFEGVTDKGRRVHNWNVPGSFNEKTGLFTIPANSLKFYFRPNAAHAQIIHPEIQLKHGEVKEFTFPTQFKYFNSRAYNAKHKEIMALLTQYGAVITGVNLNDIKLDRQLFYTHGNGSATFTLSVIVTKR